jgi:hypothetical protein
MRARGFCFVLLVAGAIVAACSSSSATPYGYNPNTDGNVGYPTTAPTVASYPQDQIPAASAAATAAPAGAVPSAGSEQAAVPSSAVVQPEDQIIKTGTITIQVATLDSSISRATDQLHGLGGWLAGSDRTVSTAEEIASVTYRVPAARFEDALAAMRTLGVKVLSEHTDSTPVGGQIVDLTARIANLRASEKAIQAIMARANTIGDVLTVQQRLADVQGQIEELSGQLAGLTDQAAYSTLTVVFEVPIKPTPSPSPSPTPTPSATATPVPWSAGDQAGQATGALTEVGKSAATVLIWLVILIVPIVLALLLLLALLVAVSRLSAPYRRRLLNGVQPGVQPAPGGQPKP